MTGILIFVLLSLTPALSPPPKYVKTAPCNQPGPVGTTHLDVSVNPTKYYVDDPTAQGMFCVVDISIEVEHLSPGTYIVVPATSSASGFALIGRGNVEMFVRQ